MNDLSVPEPSTADRTVCSFDVFDTVLTRDVSPPTAAFLLMGQRAADALPAGVTPRAFAEARRAAEQRAMQWYGASTTVDAIYSELRSSWPDAKADWKRVQDIELAVERDCLKPVPVGRALLQRCREAGHAVIFVSDMYLPSTFIQAQLEAHGLWHASDRLFVSCEYGCKKGHGLFEAVYEALDIAPEMLTHYGNCRHADVGGARSQGSTGIHVTQGNPNRYEAALERQSESTGGLSAVIAGASRHARLHTSASTEHERALRSGAASVLAPVCTGFTMWLLQQAKDHNLERLYFTARDGHVLLPIARRLATLMDIDCEIRYLYVSRASMAAANPDPEVLHRSWEFESADAAMELLNVNLNAAAAEGSQAAQRLQGATGAVAEVDKQTFTRFLNEQSGALETVLLKRRELVCQYLRKEGLDAPLRSGFVDVGWKGTVHSLLNQVLLTEGMIDSPLPGFFFGLTAKQQPYAEHRTAYFFDEHRYTGHRNVLRTSGIYTLLETFCTADHGSTIGYEMEEGTVQPILESTWPERMDAWGLPLVRETVDAFIDGLGDRPQLFQHPADLRPALVDIIQLFWNDPTSAEARAWGQFPREQGQGEEHHVEPLASPYSWDAPYYFARYGPAGHEHLTHTFSWPAATHNCSSPGVRRCIDAVLYARSFLKRGRNKAQRVWRRFQ